MYTAIYNANSNELTKARLRQATEYLRGLRFPTREQYQAEVYSQLNRITGLAGAMTPLVVLPREFPAKIGDVETNLRILNEDAQAIVAELLDAEDQAASAYNLFAATLNSLRQQIRELVYTPTPETYVGAFLGPAGLDVPNTTANLDYNAAVACCALVSESQVAPASVAAGSASWGSPVAGSSFANLGDGEEHTAFEWLAPAVPASGGAPPAALDLVFSFTGAPMLNRIVISLDDYQGLTLTDLSSSPDGAVRDDILAGLRDEEKFLCGASSKYSGDVIIDFAPRAASRLRLRVEDATGQGRIALRGVDFFSRRYSPTGTVNSRAIPLAAGNYEFRSVELVDPEFGSISHQVSPDGVHFTAVEAGGQFATPGPTWYRATLARNDAAFSNPDTAPGATPLAAGRLSGQDPDVRSNYTLAGSSATVLGQSGLVQRSMDLTHASDSIKLAETPLPGTLQVYFGLSLAPAKSWAFKNGAVVLAESRPAVRLRYQISAVGAVDLAARKPFYSPVLSQFSFTHL